MVPIPLSLFSTPGLTDDRIYVEFVALKTQAMVQDMGTTPMQSRCRVLLSFTPVTALLVILTMVETARELVSSLVVLLVPQFTTRVSS